MNRNIFILIFSIGVIFVHPTHLLSINKYVVTIKQVNIILPPSIEWVTVDENNKIKIAWKKQLNDNILYYNVYRNVLNFGDVWELVGVVNFNSDPHISDLNSFAQKQSYLYKIGAVDKCANEVFSNVNFKSIHLSLKLNSTGGNLLNWNAYEGNTVNQYRIYRGINTQSLVLIDSVSSAIYEYDDTEKLDSIVYYQIEAIGTVVEDEPEQNSVHKQIKLNSNYVKSVSNIVSDTFESDLIPFINKNLHIYPNPMVSSSIIRFPYDITQHYKLYLFDLLGNVVYEQTVENGEFILMKGLLKEGMYILQISGRKTIQKKLMIGRN